MIRYKDSLLRCVRPSNYPCLPSTLPLPIEPPPPPPRPTTVTLTHTHTHTHTSLFPTDHRKEPRNTYPWHLLLLPQPQGVPMIPPVLGAMPRERRWGPDLLPVVIRWTTELKWLKCHPQNADGRRPTGRSHTWNWPWTFPKFFPKFFDLLHLPSCLKLRSTTGTSSRMNTDSVFVEICSQIIGMVPWFRPEFRPSSACQLYK